MSGTFRADGGESWNLIARKATGNDLEADKIRRANPGVLEPIQAGTLLQIPIDDVSPVEALAPGDTKIVVGGQSIGTWDDFELGRSIDAIGKAGFTVPNEPETRAIFVPMGAAPVVISAGPTLLTGRCESPVTANAPDVKTLNISAYSTPGILERSHPPIKAFPLEWENANLLQISNALCLYHGVNCEFQTDPGPVFKRVDIQPGGPVLDFLADLSGQRGSVISSSPYGSMIFWEGVKTGNPVSDIEKGQPGVIDVRMEIDESKYYSSVTGTIPARTKRKGTKDNGPGVSFTVKNPLATDQVRPFIAEFSDIDEGELETAVNALAGRIFSKVVSVEVDLAGWLNGKGQIYEPNTTIRVKSPEDYIKNSYEFLIADVALSQNAGSRACSLRLALPGAYSGDIPEVMPWQ